MKKVIDNKIVNITDEEYRLYQKICASYDRPNFEGKELFRDHFETNGHGIITIVKPPSSKYTTMEVFSFLIGIMTSQHLRIMQEQVQTLISEATSIIQIQIQENQKLKEEIKELLSKAVENKDQKS